MNNKPVILLATNHSYMFYRFRRQLITALLAEYEVVLCTPFVGHEDDLRNLGLTLRNIEMDRRSINPLKDLNLIKEYKNVLDEVRPDVVITYSIKPNVYLAPLCTKRKIPCFLHVQGLGTAFQKPGISSVASYLYKRAAKGARGVFFENQTNAEFFIQKGLIHQDQAVVLNGAGVSLEDYPFVERKTRKGNDASSNKLHLVYLGRFMKEKGMDELLGALEELHQEGYPFQFDFAGFCEDEYTERLQVIEKEGWAKSHGFLNDPRPLYTLADCVILPSWHEGMSNVLLEGAAMGCPLIASAIPGCQEAVIDQKSGLLTEVKNQESLKQSIRMMLEKSDEERAAMGRAGRKHMEEHFSRDVVVSQTLQALHERIKKRTKSIHSGF